MNFILMLLAFFIIAGVALLFCKTMSLNVGEGFFLSVGAVTALMFLGGVFHSFAFGLYAIVIIAVLGYILMIVSRAGITEKRNRQIHQNFFCSPYFIILLVLLIYSLFAFYHDFIQRIDELHLWAAAVKYMAEHDKLPVYQDFIGFTNRSDYATSLFYVFFQKLSGYNEQNMYVGSFFLMWTGFLLPFGGFKKENWKKPAFYTIILFIAIYSLYGYGTKNLYVDLPVISWASGLAGWWINREKKRANLPVAVVGLIMICFFKSMVGPLMAVFVLLFMLIQSFLVEKDDWKKQIHSKREYRRALDHRRNMIRIAVMAILAIVIIGIVVLIVQICKSDSFLWQYIESRKTVAGLSAEKVKLTFGAFTTAVFGKALSSYSNLKIAFIPLLIIVLALFKIVGDLFEQKRQQIIYSVYAIGISAVYCIFLFASFILMFSYEESIKVAGCIRYFSVCGVFLFTLALILLFQEKDVSRPKLRFYISLGIFLVFVSGINTKYIPITTAWNETKIVGHTNIARVKTHVKQMDKILEDTDKVYMLDQASDDEFATNTALYYMEHQVNNYLVTPWRFTEKGSVIRLAENDSPAIQDLPALLRDGGYTYLWIYKSDDYLKEALPTISNCTDVKGRQLYRIVENDGKTLKLKLVKRLKK